MNLNYHQLIKIILAFLFFLCLFRMPYGYYELIRFCAFLGFMVLGYRAYEADKLIQAILYVGLALLFQPFLKVALGRTIWNIVDVVVGIGLLVSVALEIREKK